MGQVAIPPVRDPVVCSRWDGNVRQSTHVIGSARMQAKWARHTARFQNRTILSHAAYRHMIGGQRLIHQ